MFVCGTAGLTGVERGVVQAFLASFDVEVSFQLGDVNCDGEVDLLDIQPFVDLLIAGGFSEKADINMDGIVSLLDVSLFVQLLGI